LADFFKRSPLKPSDSIINAGATVALVYGIYQLEVGQVSSVRMTEPDNSHLNNTIKTAGLLGLATIAGMCIMSRDLNPVILGGAALIAIHIHYRHSNLVDNQTGMLAPQASAAYENAQYTTPQSLQAVA
jgi:hypothetical protein